MLSNAIELHNHAKSYSKLFRFVMTLLKVIATASFVFLSLMSFSQTNNFNFELRLPIQHEAQKAELEYSYDTIVQKATQINFGLDALLKYKLGRISAYTGVGFFRNRFNVRRSYNHQALNTGRDSFPIGTFTKNYTYSIVRFPFGIGIDLATVKNINIGVGAAYFFNFSVRRKYNGAVPFRGANTAYNKVNYFGNSLNASINFSYSKRGKNVVGIEPYIRIYNKYRKDRFLKEDESEFEERKFDAIGVSLRYSFTL